MCAQALFQAFREALGFMLNDLRLSVLVSEKPKASDDDESESLRDGEGRPVQGHQRWFPGFAKFLISGKAFGKVVAVCCAMS